MPIATHGGTPSPTLTSPSPLSSPSPAASLGSHVATGMLGSQARLCRGLPARIIFN